MPSYPSLPDHVAIVTGGDSGIGAGVTQTLAAGGATVAINYHSDDEAADAMARRIAIGGGRAIAVRADVSREDDVVRLFGETVAAFGRVDVRVDVRVANSGVRQDAVIDRRLDPAFRPHWQP